VPSGKMNAERGFYGAVEAGGTKFVCDRRDRSQEIGRLTGQLGDTRRLGPRNGRGVRIRLLNCPLVAAQFVRDLLRS
jgi:hypothetical protein